MAIATEILNRGDGRRLLAMAGVAAGAVFMSLLLYIMYDMMLSMREIRGHIREMGGSMQAMRTDIHSIHDSMAAMQGDIGAMKNSMTAVTGTVSNPGEFMRNLMR